MFGTKILPAIPLVAALALPTTSASAKELSFLSSTQQSADAVETVDERFYQLRSDADDHSLALAHVNDTLHLINPIFADDTSSAELKSLIALAEAGPQGYNAVQLSARILPPRRPTEMTLGEILDWAEATPGQHHAIGRYQIIPNTLRDLMRRGRLPRSARFSPAMQDDLADILLRDAGYSRFARGELSRVEFMNNLARIWAGLPTSSGRSAYHGYAGNAASITWPVYEQRMTAIFR